MEAALMDEPLLRGLAQAASPLRLRRGVAAVVPVTEEEARRARADDAHREAASAGFAEGLRQGRQEGAAAGHEEGLRSGRAEAQRLAGEETQRAVSAATAELLQERQRLQDLVDQCEARWRDMPEIVEDELVALCFETICRIVGDVAARPANVRAALVQAVEAAGAQPRIQMQVHPADAALLDRAGISGKPGQAITWRGDPVVALGGCILHTAAGELDARLETLLAGCKAALLQAREARRAQDDRGEEAQP
jgi:flagellar assembly protein FliH